ncbi:MAG TPA: polysaccharide deacetylase family protein, partial [Longimicrobiaceae bacterium]|nr:polysaccharide deacetylase family protein [Longimicrobiaceae bacterium]
MLDLVVFLVSQAVIAALLLLCWSLLGRPTTRRRQDLLRGGVSFAAALVLAGLGVFWFGNLAGTQAFGRLLARVETRDSVVALSFDDGPTPDGTRAVLPVLASRGVHATFFVNGQAVSDHMPQAKQIVAAGHELGNHGYTHAVLIGKPAWRI